ncbi:MAG: hypothetical protein QM775_07800 [Pirellulales bacterium]
MLSSETRTQADRHAEGRVARAIENQTAKLPSDTFLWAAGGSMGLSLGLLAAGRRHLSLFVGQWAAPLLIMGLYNKLVKVAGNDRAAAGHLPERYDFDLSAETVVEPDEPVTIAQSSQPRYGAHAASSSNGRHVDDRATADQDEAREEAEYRRRADEEFGTCGFGISNVADYPHDERFPTKPSEQPLPTSHMP